MDVMTCPHCRRPVDRPMFFPRSQQIIFNFVWDNPWCTIAAIQQECVAHCASNLIAVQLSKIRNRLVGTPYKLAIRNGPKRYGVRPPREYRIEEVPNVPA